jgi:uncharacterized membrane protein YkvA (DUF1232 family)
MFNMKFMKDLVAFIRSVANDQRIPERDKKILLAMLALIISPFDIIPDWIPIIGLMDDLILMAVVLDYLFNVLDQAILLSHYPWGMKSFVAVRRAARFVAFLTPRFIKERIWKYEPSIYGGRT